MRQALQLAQKALDVANGKDGRSEAMEDILGYDMRTRVFVSIWNILELPTFIWSRFGQAQRQDGTSDSSPLEFLESDCCLSLHFAVASNSLRLGRTAKIARFGCLGCKEVVKTLKVMKDME